MKLARSPILLLFFMAGSSGLGCKRTPPKASAERTPTETGLADQDVHPVYDESGPTDPLAARLCDALHALPERKRAECCQVPLGIILATPCTRTLSAAVRTKAIRLDEAAIANCESAFQHELQGCEWVGPLATELLPAACQGMVSGLLGTNTRCRSSLDCAVGLRCQGAGPTARGICAPPKRDGLACDLAVDTLASYTRQEIDLLHPECQGFCDRHKCAPALVLGAACVSNFQCGRDRHCSQGHCAAGALAAAGASCTAGGCAKGTRCYQGKCITPAAQGTPCKSDFECRGGCVKKDSSGAGFCGPRCDLR